MNNSNNTTCENLTKLNQESQNQRLRLFAKVDISRIRTSLHSDILS